MRLINGYSPHTLVAMAGLAGASLVCLPLFLTDFQLIIATEMLIMAIFALSLNLILGYGGMVHFGHATFYGLGAFTLGILTRRFDMNPYMAMILAPCVSALAGWLIGWLCVRRVELYFAILTLAFGQLIYVVFLQAREITGGDEGLHGLPLPIWLGEPSAMYGFTLAVFVVCYGLMWQLVRSPFILILKSTRENPERAHFLGVDVRQHQLMIFVIGAFFAGVAGMLMATEKRFASLDMLHWTTSAEPLLASLLGGMFSLAGAGIGAAVLVFLNFALSRLTSYWSLALGILTVILVLLAPNGLIGLLQAQRKPHDER